MRACKKAYAIAAGPAAAHGKALKAPITNPSTIANGRNGRASILASGPPQDKTWNPNKTIGSVPAWAASVVHHASRNGGGRYRNLRCSHGVNKTIAAVPTNESWNPISQSKRGTNAIIAAPATPRDTNATVPRPK